MCLCAIVPDLPSRAFFRDFAREFGALITVLHVAPAQAPEDWQTRLMLNQARENIQCLMERLGVSGAGHIAEGEPSKMWACGRGAGECRRTRHREKRGLIRLGRLHENACAIIRESPCPVVWV